MKELLPYYSIPLIFKAHLAIYSNIDHDYSRDKPRQMPTCEVYNYLGIQEVGTTLNQNHFINLKFIFNPNEKYY